MSEPNKSSNPAKTIVLIGALLLSQLITFCSISVQNQKIAYLQYREIVLTAQNRLSSDSMNTVFSILSNAPDSEINKGYAEMKKSAELLEKLSKDPKK